MLRFQSGSVALVLCACAGSNPPAPPPPLPSAASQASAGGASQRAAEQSSAESSEEPSYPPREGASGSTRLTVSCGKARCQAGKEVCTMRPGASEWVCAPKSASLEGWYACDDASDCAAPLTCCRSFASAAEVFECAKPQGNCAELPCAEPDGLRCPAGQKCSKGYCHAEARATCAPAQPCPAERPYCAWSSTPVCVAEAAAVSNARALLDGDASVSGIYACTQPSDCGTQRCCTSMGLGEKQTSCLNNCDLGNSMLLCQTVSDCGALARDHCQGDAACRRSVRCAPPATDKPGAIPPWMKVCTAD